ncbi:MAG: protein-methionine-sulfoxide reductase catalytic subunit MsrP [Gammaproteobacteria bacterium]|nr:protein-methionine-sulfoxide reductase catalytic subunit MsrP [Gammaproteobacteria bacterium]
MKWNTTPPLKASDITPEQDYLNRREFMRLAALATTGALAATACEAGQVDANTGIVSDTAEFGKITNSPYSTDALPNSYEDITTYNNFYEFGIGKDDPHKRARDFETRPWTVEVSGHCDKPGTYDVDDIIAMAPIEERIYRLRCVEAWSMVIPWVGIELGKVLQQLGPQSKAKYIRFETLYDPKRMPGQRFNVIDWPYVEGLTIAEAMHPLTLFAIGLYGRSLPPQNGAPLRLVVPWKYGFKSIKSIVKIEFTEQQPLNSWQRSLPEEYGFYANVNPEVDHPRWSQARERYIGEGLFAEKHPTLMFNGYGEYVADLYTGMDLRRNF